MIALKWKRPDGTFVAEVNGLPYHVVKGDEPLWSHCVDEAKLLGNKLKLEPTPELFEPMPVAHTRLAKADLWRRLTDDEAAALDAALSSAPPRLRRIYDAATYLDTSDSDYAALKAGVVAALGTARADEVLEPNY